MKRFLLLVASLFVGYMGFNGSEATAQNAQQLTLEDITGGKYNPQYVYGVNPMKDGESYTQLSNDSKRIIRRSFKTGKELGIVFDAETARGPKNWRLLTATLCRPMNAEFCFAHKLTLSIAALTLRFTTFMM